MLKILTYPNSLLEQKASLVKIPLGPEDKSLIKEMYKVVKGIGVGLAAPQVGILKKLFIVHLSEEKELIKESNGQPDFVVINPKITFYSNMESEMIEGCLSFPDEYYKIWRPSSITIEFITIGNLSNFLSGKYEPVLVKKKLNAKNWLSRILQHEHDHLNGKVFIKMGGVKLDSKELHDEDIID